MNKNTRMLISKYNIKPSKSWGQNFLIDANIKKKMIDALNIKKEDFIIEIGAGLGALSKEIAENGCLLAAVEADRNLIPPLEEVLKDYENIYIINDDILKLDIKNDIIFRTLEIINRKIEKKGSRTNNTNIPNSTIKNNFIPPSHIKIIGNLPYYITTPIIMKILEKENGIEIDEAVFMVQKEVAERILAKPGTKEYGSLSIAVQYYSKPEILFNVPPSAFVPNPKVFSSVLRLNIYKKPVVNVIDKKLFFDIIRASFNQRRKTLTNALFNANITFLKKSEIKDFLDDIEMSGINCNTRGEELSIEQFACLSNILSNINILSSNNK